MLDVGDCHSWPRGETTASAENHAASWALVRAGSCPIKARVLVVRSVAPCNASVTLVATPDARWSNDWRDPRSTTVLHLHPAPAAAASPATKNRDSRTRATTGRGRGNERGCSSGSGPSDSGA